MMAQPRRNLSRYSLHLTYWFLLPGIGLSLWLTTAWMMDWMLGHSYDSTRHLQRGIADLGYEIFVGSRAERGSQQKFHSYIKQRRKDSFLN